MCLTYRNLCISVTGMNVLFNFTECDDRYYKAAMIHWEQFHLRYDLGIVIVVRCVGIWASRWSAVFRAGAWLRYEAGPDCIANASKGSPMCRCDRRVAIAQLLPLCRRSICSMEIRLCSFLTVPSTKCSVLMSCCSSQTPTTTMVKSTHFICSGSRALSISVFPLRTGHLSESPPAEYLILNLFGGF